MLHKRYRPQRLSEIIGQEHVTTTLRNAAISGRLAEYQSMLLVGTRGSGKTSTARILARLVNCLSPVEGEPCKECENCLAVDRCLDGRGGDVIEMDAASNRGVEDIARILDACQYKPLGKLRYKVFIIDEAHQLSSYAKDALLKTLEEPPRHVVFILATTEEHKIPQTISSRCIRFDFKDGDIESLVRCAARVLEAYGVEFEELALRKVATLAGGSYRDVLGIVEKLVDAGGTITLARVHEILGLPDSDRVLACVKAICGGDSVRCMTLASEVLSDGQDMRIFIREVVDLMLRGAVNLVSRGAAASNEGLTPEQILELGTYIYQKASVFETSVPALVPGLVLAAAARAASRAHG